MAEGIQQIADIDKDDIPNGHNIHYNFSMRRLAAVELYPIFLEYDLDCYVLPTSWKLGISYIHTPETGQIFSFITVTRTDAAEASVVVTVKVSILDAHRNFVRYLTPICSSQVEAGVTIHGTFTESRPPGIPSFVNDLQLVLRITLMIRSCHVTENFDRHKHLRHIEKYLQKRRSRNE